MSTGFTGIPVSALDFYEDLEDDNSKTFWSAHKQVYNESVRAPIEALTHELSSEFGAGKIFRPFRDVRFSKDKTPYKTHQGVWFDQTRVYLEINAAGLRLAGGYWRTASDQVHRLRRAVADDVAGAELDRALASVRRAHFEIGGDILTRVPAGFDKEHPRATLLRHKTLVAHQLLGAPEWLATPRARTEIAKAWRKLAPLTQWLDTHVGASNEPDRTR